MAEDKDESQEKTQDPTQRRLDKAREEGKVLSSKEIFVFTSLFAGILLFYMTKYFIEDFLEIFKSLFVFGKELNSGKTLPQPAIVEVRSKSTGEIELSNTVSSIKLPWYETLTLSEKFGEVSEPPWLIFNT